jgi:replicative DNA helicase
LTIIPECAIIKYLVIYKNYKEYIRYINTTYIRNSFRELHDIYVSLAAYFAKQQEDTSVEGLQVFFYTQRPHLEDKHREIYDSIFKQIANSPVSEPAVLDLVKSIQQRERLQTLSVLAFEASEARAPISEVSKLANQLLEPQELHQEQATVFVTDNLNELYVEAIKTPGLRWRLPSLNQSLGSLRKGDFGFVFARPETGKTTFLASEVTSMALQAVQPIIWFNNEEQGSKVMLRCYQAALGLRLEQLISDLKGNHSKFLKQTKGQIKIYDQAIITKQEAESICQRLQPSLIIFDQIDKISGFKADRNDLELGEIYNWARELAKCYAPVIGVCQADGTGEGQKWLTMANVANAKTSKQAEADWILGIGRSNDTGYESVRHFNISKNKLIGDKDTLPENRHGRWDVKIQPEIARYEDFLQEDNNVNSR